MLSASPLYYKIPDKVCLLTLVAAEFPTPNSTSIDQLLFELTIW